MMLKFSTPNTLAGLGMGKKLLISCETTAPMSHVFSTQEVISPGNRSINKRINKMTQASPPRLIKAQNQAGNNGAA
jgi:hypothetical protein